MFDLIASLIAPQLIGMLAELAMLVCGALLAYAMNKRAKAV
jgi:hypothetical protein